MLWRVLCATLLLGVLAWAQQEGPARQLNIYYPYQSNSYPQPEVDDEPWPIWPSAKEPQLPPFPGDHPDLDALPEQFIRPKVENIAKSKERKVEPAQSTCDEVSSMGGKDGATQMACSEKNPQPRGAASSSEFATIVPAETADVESETANLLLANYEPLKRGFLNVRGTGAEGYNPSVVAHAEEGLPAGTDNNQGGFSLPRSGVGVAPPPPAPVREPFNPRIGELKAIATLLPNGRDVAREIARKEIRRPRPNTYQVYHPTGPEVVSSSRIAAHAEYSVPAEANEEEEKEGLMGPLPAEAHAEYGMALGGKEEKECDPQSDQVAECETKKQGWSQEATTKEGSTTSMGHVITVKNTDPMPIDVEPVAETREAMDPWYSPSKILTTPPPPSFPGPLPHPPHDSYQAAFAFKLDENSQFPAFPATYPVPPVSSIFYDPDKDTKPKGFAHSMFEQETGIAKMQVGPRNPVAGMSVPGLTRPPPSPLFPGPGGAMMNPMQMGTLNGLPGMPAAPPMLNGPTILSQMQPPPQGAISFLQLASQPIAADMKDKDTMVFPRWVNYQPDHTKTPPWSYPLAQYLFPDKDKPMAQPIQVIPPSYKEPPPSYLDNPFPAPPPRQSPYSQPWGKARWETNPFRDAPFWRAKHLGGVPSSIDTIGSGESAFHAERTPPAPPAFSPFPSGSVPPQFMAGIAWAYAHPHPWSHWMHWAHGHPSHHHKRERRILQRDAWGRAPNVPIVQSWSSRGGPAAAPLTDNRMANGGASPYPYPYPYPPLHPHTIGPEFHPYTSPWQYPWHPALNPYHPAHPANFYRPYGPFPGSYAGVHMDPLPVRNALPGEVPSADWAAQWAAERPNDVVDVSKEEATPKGTHQQ